MAVPGFQTFLRPILDVLSSGREVAHANLIQEVADRLRLTEDDRAEMLPSGKQRRYANRIGWAKTYLAKSGLVETPRRGIVRITDRGRSALAQAEPIDMDFLRRYPEYLEFRERSNDQERRGDGAQSLARSSRR
jgi:restriction system protein